MQPVILAPLASKVYLRVPFTELGSNGPDDLTTAFGPSILRG